MAKSTAAPEAFPTPQEFEEALATLEQRQSVIRLARKLRAIARSGKSEQPLSFEDIGRVYAFVRSAAWNTTETRKLLDEIEECLPLLDHIRLTGK